MSSDIKSDIHKKNYATPLLIITTCYFTFFLAINFLRFWGFGFETMDFANLLQSFPYPEFLCILHVFAISIIAIPVYTTCRNFGATSKNALIWAMVYLINPITLDIVMSNFQYYSLLVPLVALVIWGGSILYLRLATKCIKVRSEVVKKFLKYFPSAVLFINLILFFAILDDVKISVALLWDEEMVWAFGDDYDAVKAHVTPEKKVRISEFSAPHFAHREYIAPFFTPNDIPDTIIFRLSWRRFFINGDTSFQPLVDQIEILFNDPNWGITFLREGWVVFERDKKDVISKDEKRSKLVDLKWKKLEHDK